MEIDKILIRLEKIIQTLFVVLMLFLILINIGKSYQLKKSTVMLGSEEGFWFLDLISKKGTIVLQLEGGSLYPKLELMINGEVVEVFGDNTEVKLEVNDRDVIEVNSSMYNENISLYIKEVSSNVYGTPTNKVYSFKNRAIISIIRVL
ncbi:hypothetical protein [Alkaliphilus peptidifermentans]|uniref:Uncharacterized protein n=1 Tax=Alkaliphilus peptidifermentans DSM 18978 TaxID=1120976 RepID=A0A1G5KN30_9FIRM|nr:hypothetical protein [Alkaliphilus peptidifermentans]SCZ01349.1 hypothetical protein SAMN03080606_03579 [Alkaliphilus peptidifermentans DSM 18978]